MRLTPPLERTEHATLVAWLRHVAPLRWPGDCMSDGTFPFIVPQSAGRRADRTLGWAKQQGLRSGIPDFQIPIARNGYYGLFIELKRPGKTGRVSPAQEVWLEYLNLRGYWAQVARGSQEAIGIIERYMVVDN